MAGGRRGPAPRPEALARLGPKRHRSKKRMEELRPGASVVATLGSPAVPDSVRKDRVALATWKRLRPRLLRMKVLTRNNGEALEGLCVAYSRAIRADKIVRQRGLIGEDKLSGRMFANPAVSISRQAWIEVRHFAQEFGLTPASATRIRIVEDPEGVGKAKDSAESFLFNSDRKVANGGRVAGSITPKK